MPSALDRRSVSIQLGDKLQKRFRGREESFDRLAEEYLEKLSGEDKEKFLSVFEGFVSHLETAVSARQQRKM